jgi:hypothetical protein
MRRNCTKPSRNVRKIAVPMSATTTQGMKSASAMLEIMGLA